MIFLDLIILVVGFIALVKGADIFVDGSASLARKLKVSGLIIGLTIVAFGTSAPELAVSTLAALRGSNDIALSNVTGSNIFNLLCVLGVCAILAPVPSSEDILKRDMPFSIIITVIVWIFGGGLFFINAMGDPGIANSQEIGVVGRLEGIILLIIFAVYMVVLIKASRKGSDNDSSEYTDKPMAKCIVFIVIGLVLIVVGGQAVVNSAKSIAYTCGMSETLVGLTIVAIGTSLPELVTSIVAARKNETGLAVGNVVGSNIFNIMFILGITTLINPVSVSLESSADLIVLVAVSIVSYIFLITNRELKRFEGIIMILLYVLQVSYAIVR